LGKEVLGGDWEGPWLGFLYRDEEEDEAEL
jgi:hypothetical protein